MCYRIAVCVQIKFIEDYFTMKENDLFHFSHW